MMSAAGVETDYVFLQVMAQVMNLTEGREHRRHQRLLLKNNQESRMTILEEVALRVRIYPVMGMITELANQES